MNLNEPKKPQLIVPTILWASLAFGVIVLYQFLGRGQSADNTLAAVTALPLLGSVVVRFLVLPRFDTLAKVLPVFIIGMALAEGAAVIGMILGGEHKDNIVAMALVLIALFFPPFALRHLKG